MDGVASADHCQRLCGNFPGCSVFTYAKGGPDLGRCWLKEARAVANREEAGDRVSGSWSCAGGQPTGRVQIILIWDTNHCGFFKMIFSPLFLDCLETETDFFGVRDDCTTH